MKSNVYVILALVVALVALVPSSISASETELTSGALGEGYVIEPAGTRCFEPYPDDNPDVLDYSTAEGPWLSNGMFVNIPRHQPEMYIGWLLVIADGSTCLVAQGSIGSEYFSESESNWVIANNPEATSHGNTNDAETSDFTHEYSDAAWVEPQTEEFVVATALPNTGVGEPERMLKMRDVSIIMLTVLTFSILYATIKERRDQVDVILDRIKGGSPRVFDIIQCLILVLLSPVIVIGMIVFKVVEFLLLLTFCHWPTRKRKPLRRNRNVAVLIR